MYYLDSRWRRQSLVYRDLCGGKSQARRTSRYRLVNAIDWPTTVANGSAILPSRSLIAASMAIRSVCFSPPSRRTRSLAAG